MTSLTVYFLKHGVLGLASVAFAEALFFPAPPDLILVPLCVLRPDLALWYALVCTVASALGGLCAHGFGAWAGRRLIGRWVPEGVSSRIEALFGRYGGWAVAFAGLTPLPYKAFAICSGAFGMKRTRMAAASLAGRGVRFFGEALLIMALGSSGLAVIQESFGEITVIASGVIVAVWLVGRHARIWPLLRSAIGGVQARLTGFYHKRLSRLGPLAIWLASCIALASFFLLAFLWVASELMAQQLTGFDGAVTRAIQGMHSPGMTAVMKTVSLLGSAGFLIPVCLVIAWRLWGRGRGRGQGRGDRNGRAAGLALLGTLVGSFLTNELLKAAFQRSHPPGPPLVPVPEGFGFPSGHSMVASGVYIVLAYLIMRKPAPEAWRVALASGLVVLAAAVGFSRIYLGVRYPSDVVAGFAAGGLWASSAIISIVVAGERRGGRRP